MSRETDPYILALDIGTSGIRSSVYDTSGSELPEIKRKALTPFAKEGTIEPGALELLSAVEEVLDATQEALSEARIYPAYAAISCFWHSLLGSGIDGVPVTPVLTWADQRSDRCTARLRNIAHEAESHNRTGCHFHSSYWPAKLLCLREDRPELVAKVSKWLSFSDLVWLLVTGDIATSVSMASGTGIFDVREIAWNEEFAGKLGVDPASLPKVLLSNSLTPTCGKAAERWPALARALWIPPIADGAANNIGSGATGVGQAALMIGTSGAFRTVFEGPVPESIPEGLFCYRLDERRICLGGALSDGGSLRRWLWEGLELEVTEEEIARRLAERGADYHHLSFLPFVFGERSTGYHGNAEGAVIGLTRGSDAVDITIAAMEAVAYRFRAILERLETVSPVSDITASGGSLEASPAWQELIADVLGRDLLLVSEGGVSRRGAALFGLEAADVFRPKGLKGTGDGLTVAHSPSNHQKYTEGYHRHARFYERQFNGA